MISKRWLLYPSLLVVIFLLGGAGGVFFDRFVVPKMVGWPVFSDVEWLKKATEHVTVINKTEQVIIREDDTVEAIVSQPATAVVNIVIPASREATKKNVSPETAQNVSVLTGTLLTNDGVAVTYVPTAPARIDTLYTVLLYDGSDHPALLIGYDPFTHLLFLRLSDGATTPAIALANSDDARVGKKLVAIGNASVEYRNRLAWGALENINRTFNLSGKTVASSERREGVLEMSLDHPEHFVGGPVVGYNGEMIGLVGTMTLDNEAVSFLLPSNVVRDTLDRVIGGRLPSRPVLGVYYLSVTKTLALVHGLPRDRGAFVYSPSEKTGLAVIADSPADRAGLQYGDLITAVNGKEINLDNSLSEAVSRYDKGEMIELTLLRNGEEKKVSVQL